MTDYENIFQLKNKSYISPNSIFGDSHSFNGDLSEFNPESVSKRLGDFSEHSDADNNDRYIEYPDIDVDEGKPISLVRQ